MYQFAVLTTPEFSRLKNYLLFVSGLLGSLGGFSGVHSLTQLYPTGRFAGDWALGVVGMAGKLGLSLLVVIHQWRLD